MSQPIGLFLAVYDIGENQPGAPLFAVRLTVHPPTKTVMGAGQITQTTNPPLDIGTRLEGRYTAMTVMPKSTHILLTATGYPFISAPPIGPVPSRMCSCTWSWPRIGSRAPLTMSTSMLRGAGGASSMPR